MEPSMEVHPDECVALGAAVSAGLVEGLPLDAVLVDVTPHTLGIETVRWVGGYPVGDVYEAMIKRNTVIPMQVGRNFIPVVPGQRSAEIKVYQGEDTRASANTLLGSFDLEFPPSDHGPIQVHYALDASGLLTVHATHLESGNAESISVRVHRPGQVEGERTESSEQAVPVSPEVEAARAELRAAMAVAEKELAGLEEAARATLEALLSECGQALSSPDGEGARSARERLLDALAEAALA
jgi:molecular chaperone DnaK